jgi:hypothetical protein
VSGMRWAGARNNQTTPSTPVEAWPGNGAADHHRQVNAHRTITDVQCGLCPDASSALGRPKTRNGQSNQQWSLG